MPDTSGGQCREGNTKGLDIRTTAADNSATLETIPEGDRFAGLGKDKRCWLQHKFPVIFVGFELDLFISGSQAGSCYASCCPHTDAEAPKSH